MAAIILQEIDDPTYMPTDAETREYARWLGMDEKEVRGGGGIASHHIPHTCAIMLTLSSRSRSRSNPSAGPRPVLDRQARPEGTPPCALEAVQDS